MTLALGRYMCEKITRESDTFPSVYVHSEVAKVQVYMGMKWQSLDTSL
jgi:hypothetical protein